MFTQALVTVDRPRLARTPPKGSSVRSAAATGSDAVSASNRCADAPRSRAASGADQVGGAPDVGQPGDDRGDGGLDLGLGQRPVRRPEPQPVGEALLVRRERDAAVDVEQAARRAAARRRGRGWPPRPRRRPSPRARRWRGRGRPPGGGRPPAPARARGGPRRAPRGRPRRRSPPRRSAAPTRRPSPGGAGRRGRAGGPSIVGPRGAARVEHGLAGLRRDRRACPRSEPAREQLEDALGVVEVVGARRPVPGGRLRRTRAARTRAATTRGPRRRPARSPCRSRTRRRRRSRGAGSCPRRRAGCRAGCGAAASGRATAGWWPRSRRRPAGARRPPTARRVASANTSSAAATRARS